MPGIVGLITKLPRAKAESDLLKMLETLRHEPFYASGTWIDEAQGVYVGWVARKGSFAEPMPLRNERGDVTLVFSGEEFPEPGTIAALRARGHQVESSGPSYLVHRCEEESDFPKRLNGAFTASQLTVHAERRHSSMTGSAYSDFTTTKRMTRFTSPAEAKAILKVRPELRVTDSRGLGEFIVCGCVLENRTHFPASRFCLPALPGPSTADRSRRKPPILSHGNGKRKRRTSRKSITVSCVTLS